MSQPKKTIEARIVWGDTSDLSVYAVNHFVGQFGQLTDDGRPDEFILTAGFLAPPIILGDQEERLSTLAKMGQVEIRPIVRLSMGRNRLKELSALLQRMVEKLDRDETEVDDVGEGEAELS